MTETAERLAPDEAPDISPEAIAERSVLGTAIASLNGAAAVVAALRVEHFSLNPRRIVFEAVQRILDSGTAGGIEPGEFPQAVMAELARTGDLPRIGEFGLGSGGAYLHSLMSLPGSVAYCAPVIIEAARLRAMTDALESAAVINARNGLTAEERFGQIRQLVEDTAGWSAPLALRPNSDAVSEVLAAIEAGGDPGLSTGWPDLDDAIGGLRNGELIVIGARPGTGKTLCGLCMADHAGTRLGLPVLFSSLEMTEAELTARRISAASRVPLHHLVRYQVTGSEWDMISRAYGKLLETRLYVDDTSGASIGHIRGRLRAMERSGEPARLLVIDYLGFMAAPKAESRQQAVAALARAVKLLAREFSIPVVLLSQLNRGPESRSDKVPSLADLRESGEIEQTADIVILLHRPDAYDRESPRAGEIDLVIAKNRQGPLCTVSLLFQGHYGRLVSMSSEWSPASAVSAA